MSRTPDSHDGPSRNVSPRDVSHRRRPWVAVLFVVALLGIEAAILLRARHAPPEAGSFPPPVPLSTSVVSVQGDAEAAPEKRDAWRRLTSGELLSEGERLRTGPTGRLEIDLGGRARITLGPNSFLRLSSLADPDTAASAGIRLDLDRGASLVSVEELANYDRFRIVTPNAVCGVRGTRFLVSVEEVPSGEAE